MLHYKIRLRYKGTPSRALNDEAYAIEAPSGKSNKKAGEDYTVVNCMVVERTLLSALQKARGDLHRKLPGLQFERVETCERIYPPLK
ncbi:MAG TPA: hypothetical protein VFV43_00630 [Limnobacter sp.]|nr:hypothetical protein [Limnobacter sp.]